ncbi:hypothetical protein K1719_041056 [Acacia pycnantha]|nr:hypothetical protein K1719_041056 [Acacia pycnantha]
MASSLLKKLYLYNTYEIRKRNPDPKSCALLVIDMQNSYTFIVEPILSNLSTTIHLCRNASIPVIFTRHCHKSPADYGMLPSGGTSTSSWTTQKRQGLCRHLIGNQRIWWWRRAPTARFGTLNWRRSLWRWG